MRDLPLLVLLACQTDGPRVQPHGDDLFTTTGIEYVHAESNARMFCQERGQPIMRPVDKVEQTVHVTDPRIKQVELIFRCEGPSSP
jgi:hypothetical protein